MRALFLGGQRHVGRYLGDARVDAAVTQTHVEGIAQALDPDPLDRDMALVHSALDIGNGFKGFVHGMTGGAAPMGFGLARPGHS